MRSCRNFRQILGFDCGRGWFRGPARPGQRAVRRGHYLAAGGILSGPPGARSFALQLVRREVLAGSYVTSWRLDNALDRLLAAAL
jgi:hypothetical protein